MPTKNASPPKKIGPMDRYVVKSKPASSVASPPSPASKTINSSGNAPGVAARAPHYAYVAASSSPDVIGAATAPSESQSAEATRIEEMQKRLNMYGTHGYIPPSDNSCFRL